MIGIPANDRSGDQHASQIRQTEHQPRQRLPETYLMRGVYMTGQVIVVDGGR
jgi:hypothetical protein